MYLAGLQVKMFHHECCLYEQRYNLPVAELRLRFFNRKPVLSLSQRPIAN